MIMNFTQPSLQPAPQNEWYRQALQQMQQNQQAQATPAAPAVQPVQWTYQQQQQVAEPQMNYALATPATPTTPDPWGRLPGMEGYGTPPAPGTSAYPGGMVIPQPQSVAPAVGSGEVQTPQATPTAQQTWTPQPEWMDGGYNYGWTWDGQQWRKGTVVKRKGEIIGSEVGWASGMALPTDYNPALDTARFEYMGREGIETSIHRAIRIANDLVKNGLASSPQRALEFAMAQVSADAARMGKTTGWDNTVFTKLNWGEGYNESKNYLLGVGSATPDTTGLNNGGTGGGTGGGDTGGGGGNITDGAQLPDASGLTPAQKDYLATHSDQAYRYMMKQIGYNPDAPGLLGRWLEQRFRPLLAARLAASNVSLDGNFTDQIGNTINDFGGGLFSGSGQNFFAGLRNIANDALQNGNSFLTNLRDQTQAQQYMNQLLSLRYSGGNPLVQQAIADQATAASNMYDDYSFDNEGAGKNIDPYLAWLRNSKYGNIFGL